MLKLTLCLSAALLASSAKPNIIWIMADDMVGTSNMRYFAIRI